MLGNFSCFGRLLTLAKLAFSKKSFRNKIRVSNGLVPDQDQRSVGPDLGPNCLQRLSADDKVAASIGKSSVTRKETYWQMQSKLASTVCAFWPSFGTR